jgi:hypothetical protein
MFTPVEYAYFLNVSLFCTLYWPYVHYCKDNHTTDSEMIFPCAFINTSYQNICIQTEMINLLTDFFFFFGNMVIFIW